MGKTRLMIGCVGDQFLPGVKESIAESAETCQRHRTEVAIKVQPPITIMPFFGLATMRNRLCMTALEENFDYLCLLDNDILLSDRLALSVLTSQPNPVVVPWLFQEFPKQVKLSEPEFRDTDSGFNEIQWQVFSCIVLSRPFLEYFHGRPFQETFCYCEEETTFMRWRLGGWKAYQKTDQRVTLLRPPTNLWEFRNEELFRIKMPGDVKRNAIR